MPQNEMSTPAADRQPITDDRLTAERLTLADLARRLAPSPTRDEAHSMTRSMIQRYDANPDLQRLLGKQDQSYPAEALPWWETLCDARAHTPPLVRPETAAVFVASLMAAQSTQPPADYRLPIIAPVPPSETEALVVAKQMGGDMLDAMRRLVELGETFALTDDRSAILTDLTRALYRHSAILAALPAPDDALLEAADVRQLIPRSPAWLRKNVPAVKVGRAWLWKRSAVLEYIAAL